LLIKASASLESVDNIGWAPIHYATLNSHVDVLRPLATRGADLNLETTSGLTPFHIAAQLGLVDMMSLLLEIGGGAVEVNGVTTKGFTALYVAAVGGKSESISFLIQKGADMKVTTPSTWSALHGATHFSQLDIMSPLIKAGTAIDSRSKDGHTSLYLAISQI
jgi:ankyrin repeat protein